MEEERRGNTCEQSATAQGCRNTRGILYRVVPVWRVTKAARECPDALMNGAKRQKYEMQERSRWTAHVRVSFCACR
jgi:hypothetical protein